MKSLPLLITSWVITFLVCLWFVSVLYSVACSKPPTPAPAESADDYQAHSNGVENEREPNQKGSEALVSSVDKLALAIDKKRKSEERTKRENDSPSQWWTILPTIIIAGAAIVQAFIYWKQTQLMKRSLEETEKANMAADRSAQAARHATEVAERAEIQITEIILAPWNRFQKGAKISAGMQNFGKTSARDVRVRISDIKFPERRIDHEPTVLAPGNKNFVTVDFDRIHPGLTDEQYAGIENAQEPISIVISIDYVDVFGTKRRVGYTADYNFGLRAFGYSCTEYEGENA